MSNRESQSKPDDDAKPSSWSNFLFKDGLPLEKETCWFILVGVLDFFATYLLIYRRIAIEGNPVARWFLEGWGPKGMLYFKMGMVGFICVLAQLIARRDEKIARRVLWFGTFIVGCVVIYSVVLLMRASYA